MKKDNQPADDEKPEEIIDDIERILDDLHADLTNDAMGVAQARDKYKAIRPVWEQLGNESTKDPNIADIYSSGTNALSSIRDDYRAITRSYKPLSGLMGTISPSADSAVSITSTTASFIINKTVDLESDWLLPVEASARNKTSEGLKKLSPPLAETYDAIWETLYGTRTSPERGSLYLIRQVFDHLFAVLAPDKEVMASRFWHPKGKNEKNQITRAERIEYTVFNHVKNESAAKRLGDSMKHMLNVYKALNKAHERGKLDRSQSRQSLKEMQAILDDWVSCLSLDS